MRFAILLTLLLGMVLSSCATLSEDECRAGNWQAIGQADGAAGRDLNYVDQHAEACAEYGVAPDVAAWRAGRKAGLPLYCTVDNAYSLGRSGVSMRAVCPAQAQAELTQAHRHGMRYYDLGREISELEHRRSDVLRDLGTLAPDDPRVGALRGEYHRLGLQLTLLESQQRLYASYP